MSSKRTAQQVRGDIDRGRTGEKVDFPDPAAAPLGTDSEAAGEPLQTQEAASNYQPATRSSSGPLIYVAILTLLIVLAIGWALHAQ